MTSPGQQAERLAHRDQQMQEAEQLLGGMPQKTGVAKGLFEGRFVSDWVFPYSTIPAGQAAEVETAVGEPTRTFDATLEPARISREADIPREVIEGLGKLGILGMTAPV